MPAVYTQIAEAVQTTIRGLDLPGIPADHVYLQEVLADRNTVAGTVTLPAVIVSKTDDQETDDGGTNLSDDWGYPVLVTIIEAANQGLEWNDRRSVWREAIRNAFNHQRLAGVSVSKICKVEHREIIDLSLFDDHNLAVGQLLVRAVTRELVRG